MTLKETLKKDYLAHYKAQDKDAVAVLRNVNGAITTEEKSGKKPTEFTDDQVHALLAREVKKRRATAEEYVVAGATERAEKERWEADFLAAYLPAQLSDAEVREIVRTVIAESGEGAHMGQVMKAAMAQLKGRADGKLVKQVVSEELTKS